MRTKTCVFTVNAILHGMLSPHVHGSVSDISTNNDHVELSSPLCSLFSH